MQRKSPVGQRGDRRNALPSSSSSSSGVLPANPSSTAPSPGTFAFPPPSFMPTSLGMTMSDMEATLRSFSGPSSHPHLQGPGPTMPSIVNSSVTSSSSAVPSSTAADGSAVQFWRTNVLDPQYKPTNSALDLELNDFLGGPVSSGRHHHPGNPATAAATESLAPPDVPMSETPFQGFPPSLGAPPAGMSTSVVAPLQLARGTLHSGGDQGSSSMTLPSTLPAVASSSSASAVVVAASGSSPGSTVAIPPTSTSMSPSVARPAAPVTAASETPEGADYSRFVDSTDEPDLSQHKIEQKNEKCQYHNCPNRARVSQAYGKFCNRHVIVAPCGFPGCRDKALAHSSMCERHLAEGKDALHQILAARAQNVPVCRTFGCFKNDQGRGYCRGHEKLLMATGRLPKHINKRRLNSAYTMCSYPNCNKHSQRNHLCRTHGNLIIRQAKELAEVGTASKENGDRETFEEILARLQKEIRRCTHPTCTKNSQRDRLCTLHYYEKHNLHRDANGNPTARTDADAALSSTDGGGDDDSDNDTMAMAMTTPATAPKPTPPPPASTTTTSRRPVKTCKLDGCQAPVQGRGQKCKTHTQPRKAQATSDRRSSSADLSAGMATLSTPTATAATAQKSRRGNDDGEAKYPTCSIAGCENPSPYVSGLCAHHGNKNNQAMQINNSARLPSQGHMMVCSAPSCTAATMANSNLCEHHRRLFGNPDATENRPDMNDGPPSVFPTTQTGQQSMMSTADAAMVLSSGAMDRYNGMLIGGQGRMGGMNPGSYVMGGPSMADNNARQAQYAQNSGRPSGAYASGVTTCSNSMCNRDSHGREYCDLCQNIFSPLVSVGDADSGPTFPFAMAGGASSGPPSQLMQVEPESESNTNVWDSSSQPKYGGKTREMCRVKECTVTASRAGLCDTHIIAFQQGSLSVDQLSLHSQQMQEESDHVAAAQMKNAQSPRVKKYFCKMAGCDKQAQKRGLCKRHFRMQEVEGTTQPQQSNLVLSNNQMQHTPQQHCRFASCVEIVNGMTSLCPSHSKATFCWQAGCESIVESPRFCEYHAYESQCSFEGCTFTAVRGCSGCEHHMRARRCSHPHCEKFVGGGSALMCSQHYRSCSEHACVICVLHGMDQGWYQDASNSLGPQSKTVGPDNFLSGSGGFEDRNLDHHGLFGARRMP